MPRWRGAARIGGFRLAATTEGARGRPPGTDRSPSSSVRAGRRLVRGRRGRRRGRGGVLELLLRAEQGVEDLLAQVLAHGEGQSGAHDADHEHLAEPAALLLLLLRRLAQGDRCVAERLGGRPQVLLQLLVVEDLLGRVLAVLQAADRVTGRLVGAPEVLAQLLVVGDPLDVRALAHRVGGSACLGRFLLRSHATSHRSGCVSVASIPRWRPSANQPCSASSRPQPTIDHCGQKYPAPVVSQMKTRSAITSAYTTAWVWSARRPNETVSAANSPGAASAGSGATASIGIRARSVVPTPGGDSISSSPPSAPRRSARPRSPEPPPAAAPPIPSSATEMASAPSPGMT